LNPILIVPACEPGRGGGHLTRCIALAGGLRALGREAWLFISDNGVNVGGLITAAGFNRDWIINENDLPNIPWGCIILDRFQTPPQELARWSKLAPVIGIDEGGVKRNCFDFLIDILPGCHRSGANIADVSLLPLPEISEQLAVSSEQLAVSRVLVSFGQEDAAGLGLAAAEALADSNDGSMEISLLRGGLGSKKEALDDTKKLLILLTIPNLVNHLTDYDLVITHYGITAFEALYMDVPVLLVSPGTLHEKLAKAAGFYSLGVGKTAAKKLRRLLLRKGEPNYLFFDKLKDRCSALAVKYHLDHTPRQSLVKLINNITPDVSRNCTVCGAALNSPALARYAERTYHRCAHCGTIVMNRLTPPPIEYGKEYFFEQYQQQYGKTYIEDFPNLTAMAKRRLAVIKRLIPCTANGNTPRLLDIGCAYGPFLAAAREEGFSPCGIDPAEDAVRYVTDTLGIPAVQGFFPLENGTRTGERVDEQMQHSVGQIKASVTAKSEGPPLPTPYSVVSLWYVIEHFRDCVPVLAEIRKLLKSGGVLAFATPSFTGISGRASLHNFLERSPADHWTIWSPAAAKKVLKTAGFTVKKVVNSGHHPERFPLLGKYARCKKSPLYGALLAVSKIFSLGDTFEVYAVRF
jgi:spore coat polysaccharide biosynthesis predicted glycosyltransferase SpsG/2-polyprenyl-3-methyl-5-hydroxy-6-metoxy-1,4-benzoquinol methylase